MKSAYELAMERLERESGPTKKLNDEQRERIAEIDTRCDAEAAQVRLKYEQQIAAAPGPERQELEEQLRQALQEVEDKREKEKDAVWREAG